MEKISVIVPAYNERDNLPVLIKKIDKAFKAIGLPGEAILINDGSKDGTAEMADSLAAKHNFLKVIHHRVNQGLTEALISGFKSSTGDIIVFLCADLQSDPEEDIPKLLNGMKEGYDMVVGWRQNRKEFKLFGSKIYNLVSRILFGVVIHDQNWVKAFKREILKDLPLRSSWHRFIVAIAVQKGYKIKEVPTNWHPRTYGKSKFGVMRVPIALLDMLTLKFEMLFIKTPMRFFGFTGLFMIGLGGLIFLVLLMMKYFGIYTVMQNLPYLITAIFLILFGIQILTVGLLGELVVAYFERERQER